MKQENPLLITDRRTLLKFAGVAASSFLAGCGAGSSTGSDTSSSDDSSSESSSTDDTTTQVEGECVLIPEETQGPYPLLAILGNSSMVRQDITEDKEGIPLSITLRLVDINNSCIPIANAAVYIWHCDKDGSYSGYSSTQNGSHAGQTFLRGIQISDADGVVTFNTIYPGWYAGRITHVHFQIYLNDNLTVTATATSQLAFPAEITAAVYNTSLYSKGQNTVITSFAQDNIFSDGTTYQMASVDGDTNSGYDATLTVGIAVPTS